MGITLINPKGHFAILDIDHCDSGVTEMQDITDVQIEFVNLHH
ncbi:hypothetical protein [Schlesneria sp. T3-172]